MVAVPCRAEALGVWLLSSARLIGSLGGVTGVWRILEGAGVGRAMGMESGVGLGEEGNSELEGREGEAILTSSSSSGNSWVGVEGTEEGGTGEVDAGARMMAISPWTGERAAGERLGSETSLGDETERTEVVLDLDDEDLEGGTSETVWSYSTWMVCLCFFCLDDPAGLEVERSAL